MSRDVELERRAAAFFAAAERRDWETFRSLMADDAVTTQHVAGATPSTPDQLTRWAGAMAEAGIALRYENQRRVVSGEVVVEQHIVRLTSPDGSVASSDVCVVMRFGQDDLLVQLDEYLDPAAFAAVTG